MGARLRHYGTAVKDAPVVYYKEITRTIEVKGLHVGTNEASAHAVLEISRGFVHWLDEKRIPTAQAVLEQSERRKAAVDPATGTEERASQRHIVFVFEDGSGVKNCRLHLLNGLRTA